MASSESTELVPHGEISQNAMGIIDYPVGSTVGESRHLATDMGRLMQQADATGGIDWEVHLCRKIISRPPACSWCKGGRTQLRLWGTVLAASALKAYQS